MKFYYCVVRYYIGGTDMKILILVSLISSCVFAQNGWHMTSMIGTPMSIDNELILHMRMEKLRFIRQNMRQSLSLIFRIGP